MSNGVTVHKEEDEMNADQLKGQWTQFKGDLKGKWGKFTYGEKKDELMKWANAWYEKSAPKPPQK